MERETDGRGGERGSEREGSEREREGEALRSNTHSERDCVRSKQTTQSEIVAQNNDLDKHHVWTS